VTELRILQSRNLEDTHLREPIVQNEI
jgi:hypothetical protein